MRPKSILQVARQAQHGGDPLPLGALLLRARRRDGQSATLGPPGPLQGVHAGAATLPYALPLHGHPGKQYYARRVASSGCAVRGAVLVGVPTAPVDLCCAPT